MLPFKFGLIGFPLGHSLSPVMHKYWLEKAGITGDYTAFPLAEDDLADFCLRARQGALSGFNITVPYKEKIIPFLDRLAPQAKKIGAVNTVYVKENSLIGYNTDSIGFLKPLQEKGYKAYQPALILGAGGAARSVVAGLLLTDCPLIMVMNRNKDRAQKLIDELGSGRASLVPLSDQRDAIAASNLIINATSLGMTRANQADINELHLDLGPAPSDALVYDLVYRPLETGLIKQAKARGLAIIDGLDMLVAQGAEAFRIWTGHRPDIDGARALLLKILKADVL